jgi:septal ring factor EnvC (AmiA/AmiB activator)
MHRNRDTLLPNKTDTVGVVVHIPFIELRRKMNGTRRTAMKKFLIAAPLALAAVAAVATPASAADRANPGQIRSEIAQLDRQVDRLRGLSPREERRLESQVDRLQTLYRAYARDGFSRSELRRLDDQLSAVRAQIDAQSRDRNGRYDRDGRDGRYDRDGHFDRDGDRRGPDRRR